MHVPHNVSMYICSGLQGMNNAQSPEYPYPNSSQMLLYVLISHFLQTYNRSKSGCPLQLSYVVIFHHESWKCIEWEEHS
jgi:hypothetical protein